MDEHNSVIVTRQTVILAAGSGTRLGGADHGVPKPLVQVAGRPLIDHALDQAAAAACAEAIIVVGSDADTIRSHVDTLETPLAITVVMNSEHSRPNGVSLLKAEPHVTGSFFLQMADHVFNEPVLSRLAAPDAAREGCMRLLVDPKPPHLDEEDATKVQIDGELITAIGKELSRWDAIDAGFFHLDPGVFGALRRAEQEESLSVSAGMRQLIREERLAPVQVEGVPWIDVDTPQDWGYADSLFNRPVAPER